MLQQALSALTLGGVYLMFALGLSFAWGTLKVLNLAHGALFIFAAYVSFRLTMIFANAPLPLILGVAMAVGAVTTCLLDLVIFRYIAVHAPHRETEELRIMVAGVGIAAIPTAFIEANTNDTPFGDGTYHPNILQIGSARLTSLQLTIVGLAWLLSIGLALWIKRSATGRALRALASDRETSSLMGVNVTRLGVLTMSICGAFAGLAGALLMLYLGGLTSDTGDQLLLKGFAIIILGGIGSIWGTVVGAYVLAFSEAALVYWTSGTWVPAISFGVIFLVILIRPTGIFNVVSGERV
jgi:branched-chain amino acid transport system permease protein